MLTKNDKELIRALQKGLPLVPNPFAALGEKLGLSEEEVLSKIHQYQAEGYLRRIAPALRHQRVGYTANAMVIWRVPLPVIDEAADKLAQYPEVTHCYQRETRENWPYNLYTMIHKHSEEECRKFAARLAEEINVYDYQLLFSTRELKKTSMEYFCDED